MMTQKLHKKLQKKQLKSLKVYIKILLNDEEIIYPRNVNKTKCRIEVGF